MSDEVINVYWAPESTNEVPSVGEWNLLYPEPKTLFTELQEQRTKNAGQDTYFSCPATNDKFRKTYVFRNALPSEYEFDYTGNNQIVNPVSTGYINYSVLRPPTIAAGPLINFSLAYTFFSDQPLEAVFTPPMMHPPLYTRYGTVIPGQFDIGQWYRPYPLEMQMWEQKGKFKLGEEPIFYVEFKTDKKINFYRYKMNATLDSYLKMCGQSKAVWGGGMSLINRYKKFNESRTNELILKEIKNNLIE
jgi:hypothetical protein